MTIAPLRLAASAAALADDFARVRADLDVPSAFPPDVDAEAAAVAARGPQLPPGAPDAGRLDLRDLELVTIDPAGSRDLDQAFHAERQGTGFRVHYAIADVAAFVAPGGALDREAFGAARPCTSPTVVRRSTPTRSVRARRACCPTSIDPHSSGPSSSTRTRARS